MEKTSWKEMRGWLKDDLKENKLFAVAIPFLVAGWFLTEMLVLPLVGMYKSLCH